MTDEEVTEWLTRDEQRIYMGAGKRADVWAVLRALAETRAALVTTEWSAADNAGAGCCPLCSGMEPTHEAGCLLVTMPRPR